MSYYTCKSTGKFVRLVFRRLACAGLLKRRAVFARAQTSLDMDLVTLNVNLLIHLLNTHFMASKK